MSKAREAETVDHRLIAAETKQARARLTCLRPWRDRTYLGEAETQTQYRIDNFGVLVEAGREFERIGKIETKGADREGKVVWRRRQPWRVGLPLNARMAHSCASSGSSRNRTGRARGSNKPITLKGQRNHARRRPAGAAEVLPRPRHRAVNRHKDVEKAPRRAMAQSASRRRVALCRRR